MIIAYSVLQDTIANLLVGQNVHAVFTDYGLHRTSELMTAAIQEEVDRTEGEGVILIGFGLCGNGVVGLKARQHTLVIPRVDDCIALVLGSYAAYMEGFTENPTTYYLTKGWIECGSDPLREYQEYLEEYDEATARWLIDQQYKDYKRVLLVVSTEDEREAYGEYARRVAEFLEGAYEERIGSDALLRRLLQKRFCPREDRDFVFAM